MLLHIVKSDEHWYSYGRRRDKFHCVVHVSSPICSSLCFFFNLYNTSEEDVPQFHIRKYKCKIVVVAHLFTGEAEAGGSL